MDLSNVIALLFGVGGAGFITVVVASYRKLRVGKISDDESIIKRLHRELTRSNAKVDEAEHERDEEVKERRWWQGAAYNYRFQLVQAGVEPVDPIDLKEHE